MTVLLSRKSVLAAKIETTPGEVEALSTSDDAFFVYDATWSHNNDVQTRPKQGGFGYNKSVLGTEIVTITFTIDLTAPGSGSLPAWAETFLPACGWYESSTNTYNPTDQVPGTQSKTLTIGLYKDGRIFRAVGCVGTFVITQASGRPAQIQFSFIGRKSSSSDSAMIFYTPPAEQVFRDQSTIDFDGESGFVIETLTVDAGNEYLIRPDINDVSGLAYGVITNRRSVATINPEMRLVSDWGDFYSTLNDRLSTDFKEFTIQLSNVEYGIFLSARDEAAEIISVGMSDRQGIVAEDVTIGLNEGFTIEFDNL